MSRRRARGATLAALMLSSLVLTMACGCASRRTPSPSAEAPLERETVEIGLVAPLTGDLSDSGEGIRRAAELALKEANSTEEVRSAGIEFVLRAADDGADPERSAEKAAALAADAGVVGVIGHAGAECALATAPVFEEAGLAFVTMSSETALTGPGTRFVNRIVPRDPTQSAYAAHLAITAIGASRILAIDDADARGRLLAEEFADSFDALGGVQVAHHTILEVEGAAEELAEELAEALEGVQAEAIYYAGTMAGGGRLATMLAGAEIDLPLIGCDSIFSDDYIAAAADGATEGHVAVVLGVPLEHQVRGEDFRGAFEAEYGALPAPADSYAYDAAAILVQAVLDVGTDRDRIAEAVRSISFDGVTGVTQFNDAGDTLNQFAYAYRVVGGEWMPMPE